jgi:DNA-binding transcriptional ArsR family regulator
MQDTLSLTFAALADPTRRAILARLALGEATVKELAKPFPISGPAITKHLKVLEAARLISRGREAQYRPCRIEPVAFDEVASWVQTYQRIWEERFDRLDAYLKTKTAAQPAEPPRARPSKGRAKTRKGTPHAR